MKYLKIFEEYEIDPNNGNSKEKVSFTPNEINFFKSKFGKYVKSVGKSPFSIECMFCDVDKYNDLYYTVCNKYECTTIHDVIKVVNKINTDLTNLFTLQIKGCEKIDLHEDCVAYIKNDDVIFYVDNLQAAIFYPGDLSELYFGFAINEFINKFFNKKYYNTRLIEAYKSMFLKEINDQK